MMYSEEIEHDSAFAVYADNHPVRGAIVRAAFERLDAMQDMTDPQRFIRLAGEFGELTSWLNDGTIAVTETDVANSLTENLKCGWPVEMALSYADLQRKRAAHRPRGDRLTIVMVIEEKMANPKTSWAALARRFCKCERRSHDFKCRERIRQQARVLANTLERLNVYVDKSNLFNTTGAI